MTEEKALVPVRQMSISEVMTVGEMMAKSGFFSDAKDAAQAVVKILAGREMGFGPFASMVGVSIIQGKPAIGANLMAAAVKTHGYNYRVMRLDNDGCEIAFFENGQEVGRSVFTKEDATAAGLITKDNWRKYPRNMYFARAMSNGVRWYCPDVFAGAPVYTPDELGADVDDEGNMINVTPIAVQQPKPDAAQNGTSVHWIEDPETRRKFWAWTEKLTLTSRDVHEALGVEHITNFKGTKADAIKLIEAWISEQNNDHAADDDLVMAEPVEAIQ